MTKGWNSNTSEGNKSFNILQDSALLNLSHNE
jgi:hypothetical protein